MDQALALEIMLSGESVLLTGQAGSGKTYILNEFIKWAKRKKKIVAVTATTGLAATHLGGNTIHAWSGIGIHDELPKNFFKDIKKGRRELIEKTDVLIIDEISMLHDYRLEMIDEVCRTVRRNEAPFGGLQVILCGDFFQLPPINRRDSRQGRFVVHSKAWQDLNPTICYLSEQHRQDDNDFLDILTAMRSGDIRRHHAEKLMDRINAGLDTDGEITKLHTTNIDVDNINQKALDKLDAEPVVHLMQTTGKQSYVEQLQRSCLALPELTLKSGALVMCIKNSMDKKYVNGSLGIIESFEPVTNYPVVKLKNGKTITVRPDIWELRDGDKKRASLTQIPLRLAWAMTIHKSQGMTLDGALIDLSRAFVEGMGYVALSRVRNLQSLTLLGINRMALTVSPDALAIEQSLQKSSVQASEKFKHLKKQAAKRAKDEAKNPKKNEGKTPWAEKLALMRQTYPNAFMPWAETDDTKLLKLFESGKGLKHITKTFGRHPGSIKSRLKKHLGEDIKISA